MALSNIWVEPRREITESAVGIALLAVPIYADWRFAHYFADNMIIPPGQDAGNLALGMVVGVLGLIVSGLLITAFVAGTHALGDYVCDLLMDYGIYLRPRQRWRRLMVLDRNGMGVLDAHGNYKMTVQPVNR